jgi:methylglutaconyl-CoA hydratase
MGLADRLVDVGSEQGKDPGRAAVLARAVHLAEEISAGGPVAIRAALRAVTGDGINGRQPSQELENDMYERVIHTEDRNEALRAFAEKRKPVFTGR